jgi:hypothetical protein
MDSLEKDESITAEVSAGYHEVEIYVGYSEWDGNAVVREEYLTFTKSKVYVSADDTTTLSYSGESIY